MHRQTVWVWCLGLGLSALVGCSKTEELPPQPTEDAPRVIAKCPGYIELKSGTVTAKISVDKTAKRPTTMSLMEDTADHSAFVSMTEHSCKEHTSRLTYLAIYIDSKLVSESSPDVDMEVAKDSIGELELELACSKAELETDAVKGIHV